MIDAFTQRTLLQGLAQGLCAAVLIGAAHLAQPLIRRRPAQAQIATVPAAPSASAPAPALNIAEENLMNPLSWLNTTILQPIIKDVEGFFSSSNPVSAEVKTAAATVGTAVLQQVDPIFLTAETAVEGAINAALSGLGVIGQAIEIPVDVVYQLLAAALQAKINSTLGITTTTTTQATATPTAPALAPAEPALGGP